MLRDCSEALKLNPRSSKALYRSAVALVAVERYDEALDCCDRCLAYDHDNAGVKSLRTKAADLKEKKEAKERRRAEKLRREKEEAVRMAAAFRVCRILSGTNSVSQFRTGAQSDRAEQPKRHGR